MQQANLSLHPHPNDARIKCVTSEHLEQLAVLHRRPVDVPAALARLHSAQACPPLLPENPVPQTEPDLPSRLAHLETQVALLQQHLAGLALELLQERTQRYEQRLHTLETRIHPSSQHARSVSALPPAHEQRSQPDTSLNARRVHPAKGRPRAILPLIEYTADGTYSSSVHTRENLHSSLIRRHGLPGWRRSPRYASWGQQGRWSAYRDKRRAAHGWFALTAACMVISTSMRLAVLTNSRSLGLSRWLDTLQSYVTTS